MRSLQTQKDYIVSWLGRGVVAATTQVRHRLHSGQTDYASVKLEGPF